MKMERRGRKHDAAWDKLRGKPAGVAGAAQAPPPYYCSFAVFVVENRYGAPPPRRERDTSAPGKAQTVWPRRSLSASGREGSLLAAARSDRGRDRGLHRAAQRCLCALLRGREWLPRLCNAVTHPLREWGERVPSGVAPSHKVWGSKTSWAGQNPHTTRA